MSQLNYIDLFAGAGGLSEGFIKAGFEPIAHVEMDEAACYTLRTRVAFQHLKDNNEKHIYQQYLRDEINRQTLYSKVPDEIMLSVINKPIGDEYNPEIHKLIAQQLSAKSIKEIDLIIGGPPCQAYSLVGRARSANGMKDDPRNYLYVQYANYLDYYKPKMFVFENVLGLKSAKGGSALVDMERLYNKMGYSIKLYTVEANNFNVLQHRKRVIIIGWRNDFVPNLPDLEAVRLSKGHLVSEIFNDLPILQAGEGNNKYQDYRTAANEYLNISGIRNGIAELTQHIARPHTEQDKKIYEIAVKKWSNNERLDYNSLPDKLKTHNNRTSFIDRFKVVADNKEHSQTVVAHIAKDGHYYIHPSLQQNRSITVREAARLQSFPDDYYFEGVKESANRTAAFKQIGNAVPPLMAEEIAKKIKGILCR